MANNPYVNKVVFGTQTLIDISDTTATASDIASGKWFYTSSGQKVQGSASSSASVSQDANGYIVVPSTGDVQTFIAKTITQNGTYNAASDGADGYSSVIVNAGAVNVGTTTSYTSSGVRSLTFTGLNGEPKAFLVSPNDMLTGSTATYPIVAICYNGTSTDAHWLDGSSSSGATIRPTNWYFGATYSDYNITFTYSSESLTMAYTQRGTYDYIKFYGDYKLTYIY